MPAIPEFLELLEKMKAIHALKNEDYSSGGNYQNFERSGHIASWFSNDDDKSFAVLVGTKLARLANLLSKDTDPNNESIEDSFLDLTTYCALWSCYYQSRKARNDDDAMADRINKQLDQAQTYYPGTLAPGHVHQWYRNLEIDPAMLTYSCRYCNQTRTKETLGLR
jgi:hypothetical protein